MSEACTHDCSNCQANCDHRAPQMCIRDRSSALQSASNVENRTALALLFFRMDRFAGVMPISSASSPCLLYTSDEAVQITVHDSLHIAAFVVGAVILDQRVGHKDIAARCV